MDIFSLYAVDEALEEQGRPFTEEFGNEATFVIARAGNRTYTRMAQQQFEAHRHTLELKGTEAEEIAGAKLSFDLVGKVMAKSILLGWSGNVKYKGQEMPYNYDNAVLLLSHKDFREKIMGLANNFRNYLIEAQKVDEKNLPAASAGTSPGESTSTAS